MSHHREPFPPTAVELWLAQHSVGANELLSVARGDRKAAQSSITASCRGTFAGSCRVKVEGDAVSYTHPDHDPPAGKIKIRRLLEVAAGRYTDAKHQRVRAAYRLYIAGVDACNRYHYGHPALTDAQQARADAAREVYRAGSNALRAAEAAWWADVPDDPFAAAQDAVWAARCTAELEAAAATYAGVWAPEHEALARLRAVELEAVAA